MDQDGGLDPVRLQARVDAYEAAAMAHDDARAAHNRVLDSLSDHLSDEFRLLVEKVHCMSTAVACVERLEEYATECSRFPAGLDRSDSPTTAELVEEVRTALHGPFQDQRLQAIEILDECAALPSMAPPPVPTTPGVADRPLEAENAALRDARSAVADAIVDRGSAAGAPYRSRAHTIEMLTPMMNLIAALIAYIYSLDRLKARAEELGGLDPGSEQQWAQDRAGRVAAFEDQRLKTIRMLETLTDPFELDGQQQLDPDLGTLTQN